jgi:UDP-N-acetyl-D-mannosaminuronate dehydrogenase
MGEPDCDAFERLDGVGGTLLDISPYIVAFSAQKTDERVRVIRISQVDQLHVGRMSKRQPACHHRRWSYNPS